MLFIPWPIFLYQMLFFNAKKIAKIDVNVPNKQLNMLKKNVSVQSSLSNFVVANVL